MINTAPSTHSQKSHRLDDIPTDACLPQLPTVLDTRVMKDALQRHMFTSTNDQTQFAIRHCDILQIRYKPGSSCMVSYRLDIENIATGESGEQILCGRAFPDGRSQPQFEKAGTRTLAQPTFGTPLIHLPELKMVLWSFPNDRKIRTLPASIAETEHVPAFLPNWLFTHRGPEWHVSHTTSNIMHYVGEHTCTVRMTVELLNTMRQTPDTMTIFGKTYYDEEGAQTDQVMRQLWDSAVRRSGRLHLAQPLWYDAQRHTLWQLGIQGSTLADSTIGRPDSAILFMKAARAIATFHATPLSDLRSITIPNILDKLQTVGSLLLQCRPSIAPVLIPLLDRLTTQAKIIPASPVATLHGDLHMKNLFLTNDKIALIDLDNVGEGPPAWDIGSFVAGLLAGALTTHDPHDRIADHVALFLDHYNQSAPWQIDVPVLAWYTAVALIIERSHRCITRLKAGQRGQVDALVHLADQLSHSLSWEPLTAQKAGFYERSLLT